MRNRESPSKHSRTGLQTGLFLSTLSAIAVSVAAPQFSDVLTAFGEDIPWLSGAVIRGFWLVWLLPALAVLAWFAWPVVRQRNAAALGVGIVSFLVVLPVCLIALYLPIFKLGATV